MACITPYVAYIENRFGSRCACSGYLVQHAGDERDGAQVLDHAMISRRCYGGRSQEEDKKEGIGYPIRGDGRSRRRVRGI